MTSHHLRLALTQTLLARWQKRRHSSTKISCHPCSLNSNPQSHSPYMESMKNVCITQKEWQPYEQWMSKWIHWSFKWKNGNTFLYYDDIVKILKNKNKLQERKRIHSSSGQIFHETKSVMTYVGSRTISHPRSSFMEQNRYPFRVKSNLDNFSFQA